jgi:8-oxo-dGTP diphosphatase
VSLPKRISDIDWTNWSPVDPATLIFIVQDEQILLIRKKQGLGAGKINGPGGRLNPDEAPAYGAARELHEELGVTAIDSVKFGEHRFQFVDGYSLHVHVYLATGLRGTPVETDEAAPIWYNINDIPYEEMWEDDRIWLPLLLARKQFSGYWLFNGDRMLDYFLDVVTEEK